jgi:hypothetical protein
LCGQFRREAQGARITIALRWLAPAAACAFLAFTMINQETGLSAGGRHIQPISCLVASNQTAAAGSSTNISRTSGAVSNVLFDWTNRSESTSSIGSFLPAR